MKTSIQKAVDLVGGQTALAIICGVKQAHVWQWLNTTKDGVSAERVIDVAKATDWQVTPHELRPDIYPHPQDGLPEQMRVAA